MCRGRLLECRPAVAEAPPLRGPHLEETEELAIVRRDTQTRLAPRDAECLPAIAVPEDVADGRPRAGPAERLQRARGALSHEAGLQPRGGGGVPRQARTVETQLSTRLRADDRVGQQPGVLLEEPDHSPVLLERLHMTRERLRRRLRLGGRAERDDHQGTQTQHQGFQTSTS